MNKTFIIILALVLNMVWASGQAWANQTLLISAAASLKDAFTQIGADFEKTYNVAISFNFAASGQLKTQIEMGAPVDIFASASQTDMDALEKKNLLAPASRTNFAKNTLVMVQYKNSKSGITAISDLAQTTVSKIAIGNPETVPAGRYAREALTYYTLYSAVKNKLVFGENVRQVLDYVAKNEVDAGFVFSTDAQTNKSVRIVSTLPKNTHKPIIYPIAIIKTSNNSQSAKAFITFLMSESSKKTLKAHGFNE